MSDIATTNQHRTDEGFDYSTAEAQQALMDVTHLLLDVRNECHNLTSKVTLYERTLGLAVMPMLLRRAALVIARRLGRMNSRSR